MSGYPREPGRYDTHIVAKRAGAQFIDDVIFLILLFSPPLITSILSGGPEQVPYLIGLIGYLVGFTLSLGYWLFLEDLWDGFTVGKKVTGIKVVEEDGGICTLKSSFLRNLLEIVDRFGYFIVGLIVMLASNKRQRIGDHVAGTVVVRES